jgi:hypothetical protein
VIVEKECKFDEFKKAFERSTVIVVSKYGGRIVLRKFKHYPKLSRETAAYTCEVLIDGVLHSHATSDGNGGLVGFSSYEGHPIVDEVKASLASDPEKTVDMGMEEIVNAIAHHMIDRADVEKAVAKTLRKGLCAVETDSGVWSMGEDDVISFSQRMSDIGVRVIVVHHPKQGVGSK